MKSIAFALSALALASAAQAATVNAASFAVAIETTEISQTFNVPLFDGTLGTLDSVSFVFSGQAVSSASFINAAAQEQNFAFASNLNLFLDNAATGVSETLALSLFNYPRTLTALGTTDLGTTNASDSLSFTVTSNLAAFIGSGSTTFTCESLVGNTQAGGGGNITVNQETQAGCGLEVVYNYSATPIPAVPEPASLALLGLALAGIAGTRRKAA